MILSISNGEGNDISPIFDSSVHLICDFHSNKFVHLRATVYQKMKFEGLISAAVSLLMAFWYVAVIVGLDVHIDHHDDRVFVVSLLGHTDCESLHPDDKCHCMEHHQGNCHEHDEDCENDIVIISLTGDGFNFVSDFTPATVQTLTFETPAVERSDFNRIYSFTDCEDPPREYLRKLCVLRG